MEAKHLNLDWVKKRLRSKFGHVGNPNCLVASASAQTSCKYKCECKAASTSLCTPCWDSRAAVT